MTTLGVRAARSDWVLVRPWRNEGCDVVAGEDLAEIHRVVGAHS